MSQGRSERHYRCPREGYPAIYTLGYPAIYTLGYPAICQVGTPSVPQGVHATFRCCTAGSVHRPGATFDTFSRVSKEGWDHPEKERERERKGHNEAITAPPFSCRLFLATFRHF